MIIIAYNLLLREMVVMVESEKRSGKQFEVN